MFELLISTFLDFVDGFYVLSDFVEINEERTDYWLTNDEVSEDSIDC